MSLNLSNLNDSQLNKYDTVTEKFEGLVHKQARTLFLKDVERDFMQYVSQHFYSGVRNQQECVPTEHCLDKAYEMARVVFV